MLDWIKPNDDDIDDQAKAFRFWLGTPIGDWSGAIRANVGYFTSRFDIKPTILACLIILAVAGCDKPSGVQAGAPNQPKPQIPASYGVYLQDGDKYQRLELESSLDGAIIRPVLNQPLRILVFSKEVAGNWPLERQVAINRAMYVDRVIEQVAAGAKGMGLDQGSGERSPIVRYLQPEQAGMVEESKESVELEFQPVGDNREAVTAIVPATIPTGLYVLSIHQKKLPLLIGFNRISQLPENLKFDLWLTTLDERAGGLAQIEGTIGASGRVNGRTIMRREIKPVGTYQAIAAAERTSFERAVAGDDIPEMLQAYGLYKGLAGQNAVAAKSAMIARVKDFFTKSKASGDWHFVAALANTVIASGFDEQEFRDALAEAQTQIARKEKAAEDAYNSAFTRAAALGEVVSKVEGVKPNGNFKPTTINIHTGGISWKYDGDGIFGKSGTEEILYRDMTGIQVDDRVNPLSGKKANTASLGPYGENWSEFRDQKHRDGCVALIENGRRNWEKKHAQFLITTVSVANAAFGDKVFVKGCRFEFSHKGEAPLEYLFGPGDDVNTAAAKATISRSLADQTYSRHVEFLRFRASTPTTVTVIRFPFQYSVEARPIQVVGYSMGIVASSWGEAFGAPVEVSGEGSGLGVAQLLLGSADIATIIRPLEMEEIAGLTKLFGAAPVVTKVAYNPIAVFVHKDNPISKISFVELLGIYFVGGTINDWKQLGAPDSLRIAPGGLERNSSNNFFFRNAVGGKRAEFKAGISTYSGSTDVIEIIVKSPSAIGYAPLAYRSDGVKALALYSDNGRVPVMPTGQTIRDGTYPLSMPLYFVSSPKADQKVKKFIEFATGKAGQSLLEKEGFTALNETK